MGNCYTGYMDDLDDMNAALQYYGLEASNVFKITAPSDPGIKLVENLWRNHTNLKGYQVEALVAQEYERLAARAAERQQADEIKQLVELLDRHGLPKDWAELNGWHETAPAKVPPKKAVARTGSHTKGG